MTARSMPSTTYINYEEKKGFWIGEFTFEIICAFIVTAFEQITLQDKPDWYLEIFEDFDEIRKGHLQRRMVLLLEDYLAFLPEKENKIIEVFELAKKLTSLRNKGILIIGSGNIVHNLRLVDFPNFEKDNYGYDWAIEARETSNKYLLDGDFKPLINFEKLGKAFQLAIPTPEHYLPLIYSLGLKQQDETISLFNDKLLAGSLSMTSLKIA